MTWIDKSYWEVCYLSAAFLLSWTFALLVGCSHGMEGVKEPENVEPRRLNISVPYLGQSIIPVESMSGLSDLEAEAYEKGYFAGWGVIQAGGEGGMVVPPEGMAINEPLGPSWHAGLSSGKRQAMLKLKQIQTASSHP